MTDEELLEKLRPVFEVYQNKEYVYQSKMPIHLDARSALEYVKEYRPDVYREIMGTAGSGIVSVFLADWLVEEAGNLIELAPEEIRPILHEFVVALPAYYVTGKIMISHHSPFNQH